MGLVYLPTFTTEINQNVGKYTIHGCCGYDLQRTLRLFPCGTSSPRVTERRLVKACEKHHGAVTNWWLQSGDISIHDVWSIWFNYSDLTRPHPKLNPHDFREIYLGWWNIIMWPDQSVWWCLELPLPSEITLVGGSPSGWASFVCGYTASTFRSTGMVGVWAEHRVFGR